MHIPVAVNEVLENLVIKEGGRYVDATAGLGGHTKAILEKDPRARVLALDADEEMLDLARPVLEPFGDRAILQKGNYQKIVSFVRKAGWDYVDGVLADFGLNSAQLDDSARGFSFKGTGPLDMRFDQTSGDLTAAQIINQWPEREIIRILQEYGELQKSYRISGAIIAARKQQPIVTTSDLTRVLLPHIPRGRNVDILSRIFQALRITVNNELAGLENFLNEAIQVLGSGGRIVVISYHSLEDRLVKNFFKSAPQLRVITKKVIKPHYVEIRMNRRSRSAKVRVAEKN